MILKINLIQYIIYHNIIFNFLLLLREMENNKNIMVVRVSTHACDI